MLSTKPILLGLMLGLVGFLPSPTLLALGTASVMVAADGRYDGRGFLQALLSLGPFSVLPVHFDCGKHLHAALDIVFCVGKMLVDSLLR